MEIVRASIDFADCRERMSGQQKVVGFDLEDDLYQNVSNCLPSDLYAVSHCRSILDFEASEADLVVWSLNPPFEIGLNKLLELRLARPNLRVVLIAPPESLAHASAIKAAHVEAFILKPTNPHELMIGIDRALGKNRMPENRDPLQSLQSLQRSFALAAAPSDDGRDLDLIGSSPEIRKVVRLIRKIGGSTVNVLVTGESGSGKEMVARALHRVSPRADKPFIAINCAAIPKELLESELFGHAKGAFTGASSARRGLFEEAHQGTVLLDEIGDLPLPLQAKILRLLQTKQVKPLGQNASREVDVRIISATHKNLKLLIKQNEFREDLYYRLNVMPIHLPALRERKEDIVPLAEHFLRRFAEREKRRAPQLTRQAQTKLTSLPWKGNVRELENVIERSIVLSDGKLITEGEIYSEEIESADVSVADLFSAGLSLKEIEREYISYVLSRTGNRKEVATRILGIDRKTLYRKEKLYGIRLPNELN